MPHPRRNQGFCGGLSSFSFLWLFFTAVFHLHPSEGLCPLAGFFSPISSATACLEMCNAWMAQPIQAERKIHKVLPGIEPGTLVPAPPLLYQLSYGDETRTKCHIFGKGLIKVQHEIIYMYVQANIYFRLWEEGLITAPFLPPTPCPCPIMTLGRLG